MASKPPSGATLNTGHALAAGMIGCYLLNEGSGTTLADLSGVIGAASLVNSPTWVTESFGPVVQLTPGVLQYIQLPSNWATHLSTDATLVLGIKRRIAVPAADGDSGFCYLGGANVNNHYPYADSNIYCSVFRSARVTVGVSPIDLTAYHQCAITSSNVASGWNFYLNSTLASTADGSFEAAGSTIGQSKDPLYFDANISYAYFYNRALSSAEVASLVANPYQMINSRPPFVPPSRIGGGLLQMSGGLA